ncbi:hypothetical protein BJF83_20550 [Nocardiopsis sp. CNR-923]|uniref:hypothetical protein n=1 Tax=Nocardiopsis sp. CNR-923 TaxID=1904965 RepID=UPI000967474C|nr:hypothetical protein [Nocardiopsis sp. CNR-923]OLT26619.1 hypothetical protein BJF83_20550 [Nocardiopsis sp. CNR-923]
MLSLAGTDIDDSTENASARQENHQSFADSFINTQADRESMAETGIGNRGVSTALVASLTVPVDELSGIIGSRLLRSAVEDMQATLSTGVERDDQLIGGFLSAANLYPLVSRNGIDFAEPQPVNGSKEIAAALYDRAEAMRQSLDALRGRLSHEVAELAQNFDHRAGLRDLLSRTDPFRAQRVILGSSQSDAPMSRLGVLGLLQQRRNTPPPPEHITGPPPIPEMRDRIGGLRKIRYTDPAPVAARADQDDWYDWQTRVSWSEAWSAVSPRWSRAAARLRKDITSFVQQLEEHARNDHNRFERLSQQLYRPRTGVSYLLPPSGGDLEPFFVRVREHMIRSLHETGHLHVSPTDGELVEALVGPQRWREAFDISVDRSPAEAVAFLRETLKSAVKIFLRDPGPDQTPMLPRLTDLLGRAAGQDDGGVTDEDLSMFRAQVAGMLPIGYVPQGNGPLKILITYHAAAANPRIEQYLRESLNLPRGAGQTYEFRAVSTESVSVVLFRSSMSITEVPEVREVMRLWTSALDRPSAQDYLPWRQRLGYDFSYLATTERHRAQILHRLLCALWNGRATFVGACETAPEEVHFTLGGGVTMPLRLSSFGEASSWGQLLHAYERWAFNGEDVIANQFSAQLMAEIPIGIDSSPIPPDGLFEAFHRIVTEGKEVARLAEMAAGMSGPSRSRALQLRDFWTRTARTALRMEFQGVVAPRYPDLRALYGGHLRTSRPQGGARPSPEAQTQSFDRRAWDGQGSDAPDGSGSARMPGEGGDGYLR